MNYKDWVAATGTSYVGLGGSFRRPPNPKLLPALVAKARPKKSAALTRQTRRTILSAWQASLETDRLLSSVASQRRTVHDPSIYEQSKPGAAGVAAALRHAAAVQRARKF